MPAVAGAVRSGNRGRLHLTKVPETTGPWRARRRKHPREIRLPYLPKAADFGRDRGLSSVIPLIHAFRTLGAHFDQMLAAEFPVRSEISPHSGQVELTRSDEDADPRGPGRPPNPGRWELAATAFVASNYRSVQAFCSRFSGTGLWRECGFGDWEPDDRTVRLHFEEIEDNHCHAFAKVANAEIALAHSRDPRVGTTGFGDGTKWQSPALVKRVEPQGPEGRHWNTKNVLKRANEDDFQSLHEKESAEPEPEDDKPDEIAWADERGNLVAVESAASPIHIDELRGRQYFEINGVEYYADDVECGLRKVEKQPGNRVDVWFGGIAFSITDGFTGLRLSTQVFRADEQEFDHIPAAIEEIRDTLGAPPLILSVDRFSSIKDMYEYCAWRGIYLVAHYKGSRQKPERKDLRCDSFDEHQIPRCPHCGGEGDILGEGLGHYWEPGPEPREPRVRARCRNLESDECRAHPIFSVPCAVDYRMMTGLPLTTQLWHAVAERHGTWESIFGNDRDRSGFAGKDTTGMLARRGVAPQRLRGEISRMLDWFRLCLRQGWIEGWERQNPHEAIDLMADQVNHRGVVKYGIGKGRLARVMGARRRRGLNLPYGSVAERLGLVAPPADVEAGEPPPDADAPA